MAINIPVSIELGGTLGQLKKAQDGIKGIGTAANSVSGQNLGESLRAQIVKANKELDNAVEKFGAFSNEVRAAGARVAGLKDRQKDLKLITDAFDPDAKFLSFSNAVKGVTGAFTALQGAQAIFGSESEDVAKALAKVQGALALSQGINSILESKDAFKALAVQIASLFTIRTADATATTAEAAANVTLSNAQKSAAASTNLLKVALASTGIGLLVVAVGALAVYWDDVKKAVTGVDNEQQKLIKSQTESVTKEEKKLDLLKSSDETLKAQGLSEKEILRLKSEQVLAALDSKKVLLETNIAARQAQVEASKSGFAISKSIIDVLTLPIGFVLDGISLAAQAAAKLGAISEETANKIGNLREKFTGGLASLIFDPKKEKKEADAATEADKKALVELQNEYNGYQNKIKEIDKQAADDRKKSLEERNRLVAAAEAVAFEIRLKNSNDVQRKILEIEKKFEQDKKTLAAAGIKDFSALEKQKQTDIAKVIDDANNAAIATRKKTNQLFFDLLGKAVLKQIEIQKQGEDLAFRAQLSGIKDQGKRRLLELNKSETDELAALQLQYDKKLIAEDKFEKQKADIQAYYRNLRQVTLTDEQQKDLDNLKATQDLLASSIADASAAFADALASGADPFAAVFKSLANSLGNYLQELGKQAIVASKLIQGLKKGIGTPQGIFVGIALVALGALLKAAFNKKAESGFASGGFVSGPGSDTSDSIPARLSKGEYVVRARAVRKVGVKFLDELNQGGIDIRALTSLPSRALVNRAGNPYTGLDSGSRAIVNRGTPISAFSEGGLVLSSNYKALVNRSSGFDLPGIDLTPPGSRALVNRPLPDTPRVTNTQVSMSGETMGGAIPYIAETRVSGQDLKIILSRADRRYSNVT